MTRKLLWSAALAIGTVATLLAPQVSNPPAVKPPVIDVYSVNGELWSTPSDGSVVFWKDSALVKPILRQTGSRITHAAIVLDGFVIEAVPPRVHKVRFADYVKDMKETRTPGFKWFVTQPKVPYTRTQIAAMTKYAQSQIGRPYRLRGWRKGREVRGIFCSELVADILEQSGRIKSAGVHESPGSLYEKLEPLYQ
jgi:hypothetical protein